MAGGGEKLLVGQGLASPLAKTVGRADAGLQFQKPRIQSLVLAAMILLRVRTQASGSLVGANLAPVSHTKDEGPPSDLGPLEARPLDWYVCKSGSKSDDDDI